MTESETEQETPLAPKPIRFSDLNLSNKILDNLKDAGFESPTPIQAQFIPECLTGKDVLGQAQTGTGKTAAFLLPVFQRLNPGDGNPSVLILAPTRELALQIEGETARLGKGLGFSHTTLYGGSDYAPQIKALSDGVDIVVGTPGRLMDHMRSRRLSLSTIRVAILDEADRMLDLGFRKDIEYILKHCPKERQTLLLSATIPDEIQRMAQRFMNEPSVIRTGSERLTVDQVEQSYIGVEKSEKWPTLLKLLDEERPPLAIIFCRTKREAKKLAGKLNLVHINAREIHGDLIQSKRERIMAHFRKGRVQILVATDVASRGIDVDNITHIVNYDIPFRPEDYVHRIGRTGRMEKSGKAFTLVERDEAEYLTEIEQLINRQIDCIQYDSLNSHFWPNPPTEPLPEFANDDSVPEMSASDYLTEKPDDKKKGGKTRSRSKGKTSDRAPSRSPAREGRNGHKGVAKEEKSERKGSTEEGKGSRRPRKRRSNSMVDIVCSACSAQTQVPFKPNPDKPVYCPTCYQAKKVAEQTQAVPVE